MDYCPNSNPHPNPYRTEISRSERERKPAESVWERGYRERSDESAPWAGERVSRTLEEGDRERERATSARRSTSRLHPSFTSKKPRAVSTSMVSLNKSVLSSFDFNAPIAMLLIQCTFCALFAFLSSSTLDHPRHLLGDIPASPLRDCFFSAGAFSRRVPSSMYANEAQCLFSGG